MCRNSSLDFTLTERTCCSRKKMTMTYHEGGQSSTLFRAYQSTEFRVNYDNPFSMLIGKHCSEIEQLFQWYSVASAAFMTPFNPRSEKLSDEENFARLFQMEQEIKSMGYRFIQGIGIGQSSELEWTEHSFLVLGMSESEANNLSSRYEQNAYVFVASDCIPTLIADFGNGVQLRSSHSTCTV